jgi:hypothetical protein
MINADISIIQVEENPINNFCASGHNAKEFWDPENKDPSKRMKFFRFIGGGINGIFCEECLSIANSIARKKKI